MQNESQTKPSAEAMEAAIAVKEVIQQASRGGVPVTDDALARAIDTAFASERAKWEAVREAAEKAAHTMPHADWCQVHSRHGIPGCNCLVGDLTDALANLDRKEAEG